MTTKNYTIVQPYQGSIIVKMDNGEFKLLRRNSLSNGYTTIAALVAAKKAGKAFSETEEADKVDGQATRAVVQEAGTGSADDTTTDTAGTGEQVLVATPAPKKKRAPRKAKK